MRDSLGPRRTGSNGFKTFSPLPLDRVVYSFHMYAPGEYTHQGVYFPRGAGLPGRHRRKALGLEHGGDPAEHRIAPAGTPRLTAIRLCFAKNARFE